MPETPEAALPNLVDALAYALARAALPGGTETSRDYAARIAPLVIGSGYLSPSPRAWGLPKYESTQPEAALPLTDAGRVLLREHSSGTPHMARHIVAIEQEAALRAEAARGAGLDVERLARALEVVRDKDEAEHHDSPLWQFDEEVLARQIAAEYAALASHSPATEE